MAIRTDQYTNTLSVVDTVNANASLSLVPQGTGSISMPGTGQNFLLQSNTFSNVAWIKNTVTLTGSQSDPFGGSTATKVDATGGDAYLYQAYTVATGLTYTFSVYLRADTNTSLLIRLYDTLSALSTDVSVTATTSWQRFSVTRTVGSGTTEWAIIGSLGTLTTGETIYAYGTQVEIGSVANTYIPTTTSAIYGTPSLSFSGISGLGLQSDGSLYASSAGAGNIRLYTNNVGQEQARISNTASAVNYVNLTGGATTVAPTISAQGSDANIVLRLGGKGSGTVDFSSNGNPYALQVVGIASGTNYNSWRATSGAGGSGASSAPVMSTWGIDTNISAVLQSKGTGAIDLAAGSSGVNISNGGTVTAITRTALGTYTSNPTLAISAPTTAGGVQSTANAIVQNTGATIAGGGTGYTVGDTISMVGGTLQAGLVGTFTVATVSGGVITAVNNPSFSQYSSTPTNPVSVTGGTGSGATLNVTYIYGYPVITNAGSGYVEQPTVTFSGGGGSGAAAYATVGSGTVVRTLGGTMDFSTPSGRQFQVSEQFSGGSTAANYIQVSGRGAGAGPTIGSQGTDTNISVFYIAKGSGSHLFTTSAGAVNQFEVAHTASAVNNVQVRGAATGSGPTISAQGSDTNVNLFVSPKGTGALVVNTAGGYQFIVSNTPSSVNWLEAKGGATGSGPQVSAAGTDTNIPLVLQPKGTGALQAQQTDSTITGGNVRGVNAVDWQTLRGAANQVASSTYTVIGGGSSNRASSYASSLVGGIGNVSSAGYSFVGGGLENSASNSYTAVVGGFRNNATGVYNFVGGGYGNSGTALGPVTSQSATMNGTTAVTLSASNANIKVGQYIAGSFIAGYPNDTYVTAVSGTSLTLSQVASGSGTATLFFYTPHGVVVGGGNNQATGSYSFIGGGGDAGTAANRNVASGDYAVVVGGRTNTASGIASFVGGGGFDGTSVLGNTASSSFSAVVGGAGNVANGFGGFVGSGAFNNAAGTYSAVLGGNSNLANGTGSSVLSGYSGTTRGIAGSTVFAASQTPISSLQGGSQATLLVLGVQTTDATATVLRSTTAAAGTTNQVIMPNNSAYFFTGEVVAGVTGGGNTKGWTIEGVIKRGANAASTALVGTPTVTSMYADVGAATWTIALSADTTNGGLAVTFTGQLATTIRVVAQIRTTEMTF